MHTIRNREARILIIDDADERLAEFAQLLGSFGFANVQTLVDPCQAFDVYLEYQPDLVILDLSIQHRSGFEVVEEFAALISRRVYVPVLVIASEGAAEAKELALASGAMDFITKPFNQTEVVLRLNNLLLTRKLHLDLEKENERLEARVRERTRDLEEAHVEILERLARAAEYRDDDTGTHTQRVGALSEAIARKLRLPEADAVIIGRAALLHDVGKIGVPDHVLLKPSKLTAEEMAIMQKHVDIGAELLSDSRSKLLKLAEVIALNHHERWNGSGYLGLSREEIPLPGRIVAVADVFDALVSRRPYKEPWPLDEAVAEIRRGSGHHFDPDVVEAFFEVLCTGLPKQYDGFFENDQTALVS